MDTLPRSILPQPTILFKSFVHRFQVRAHQLVLPPCDVVIKAVSEYVGSIKNPSNLDIIGRDVFKHSQVRQSLCGVGFPSLLEASVVLVADPAR